MNCIENLPVCKASCCKLLSFIVHSFPGDRFEEYYLARGLKIKRRNRNELEVFIENRCVQLNDDNLCRMHDSKDKPLICKNLNSDSINSGRYVKTEGCNL